MPKLIALALLLAAHFPATAQDTTPLPNFEVVSIKPAKPNNTQPIIQPTDNGIRASGVTLSDLVRTAYYDTLLLDKHIAGSPAWTDSERFDIQAKVDDGTAQQLIKLSRDQRALRLYAMLRPLLADRFKLTIHKEIKDGPAFFLVIAKSGPKMKPGTPVDGFHSGTLRPTGTTATAQDVSIDLLISLLRQHADRPIIDKTGLTGRYDFKLDWSSDETSTPILPTSPDHPDEEQARPAEIASAIFNALERQLGLKLEPAKAPRTIIVIDHVDKPTEN
jgi:uncharacterized protein (TIGR03435 family)